MGLDPSVGHGWKTHHPGLCAHCRTLETRGSDAQQAAGGGVDMTKGEEGEAGDAPVSRQTETTREHLELQESWSDRFKGSEQFILLLIAYYCLLLLIAYF